MTLPPGELHHLTQGISAPHERLTLENRGQVPERVTRSLRHPHPDGLILVMFQIVQFRVINDRPVNGGERDKRLLPPEVQFV